MKKQANFIKNLFNSKYLFYVLILILIVVFVSLIKVAKQRLVLNKQSNYYNEKIQEIESENKNLASQIEIAKSEYFKEKAARNQFGLQKPGEKVIIFNQEKENDQTKNKKNYLQEKFSNIKAWWQHFFK